MKVLRRYFRNLASADASCGVNFDEFLTQEKKSLQLHIKELKEQIAKLEEDLQHTKHDYERSM